MAIVRTDDTYYKNIANKIRANTGVENTYLPEDMEEGVDEVYKAGQASMVDKSKVIEKTISGSGTVIINDISEIPHDVSIQITGGTTDFGSASATVTGANMCKPNANDLLIRRWYSITRNADGSITVNGTANTDIYLDWFELIPVTLGQTFYFFNNTNDCRLAFQVRTKSGSILNTIVSGTTETKYTIIEDTAAYVSAAYTLSFGSTFGNLVLKPFISLVPSCEYEAYREQNVTFDTSGKAEGIVSYCPIMMIKADDDITFDINYHKSWGRQAQYEEFWAGFLTYGGKERTVFDHAFAFGWNNETARCPVTIYPTKANSMFNYSGISGDLTEVMDIDFSNTTEISYGFCNWSLVTKLGVIDFRKVTLINYCFWGMTALKEIVEFYPSPNVDIEFPNCPALENITIMSPITRNFTISSTTVLNAKSISSIVGALSDGVSGKTLKVSATAVQNAKFDELDEPTDWETLVASKPNWKIDLV